MRCFALAGPLAAAAALLAGCSSTDPAAACDDKTPCPSGQVCQAARCVPEGSADMAQPAADAAGPSPDLTTMVQPAGVKFATNKLVLPKSRFQTSIDIDGNGVVDNQLGSILNLLASQGTDFQADTDFAVKQGLTVQLFEVQPADLSDSKTAAVALRSAAPRVNDPPAYDGNDTFQVGPEAAVWMTGALQNGALTTKLPRDLTPAEVKRFRLIVPIGGGSLRLDLYGVHVQATTNDKGMTEGQFHGVVRKQDIDTQIIPSVAELVTAQINMFPAASQTLITTFETGPVSQKKCQDNMADCCRTNPKTCKITPDEVRANQLIQIILVPDLQCYDAQGSWKPIPNGVDKDCLSVGLGFTAVRAKY